MVRSAHEQLSSQDLENTETLEGLNAIHIMDAINTIIACVIRADKMLKD